MYLQYAIYLQYLYIYYLLIYYKVRYTVLYELVSFSIYSTVAKNSAVLSLKKTMTVKGAREVAVKGALGR